MGVTNHQTGPAGPTVITSKRIVGTNQTLTLAPAATSDVVFTVSSFNIPSTATVVVLPFLSGLLLDVASVAFQSQATGGGIVTTVTARVTAIGTLTAVVGGVHALIEWL